MSLQFSLVYITCSPLCYGKPLKYLTNADCKSFYNKIKWKTCCCSVRRCYPCRCCILSATTTNANSAKGQFYWPQHREFVGSEKDFVKQYERKTEPTLAIWVNMKQKALYIWKLRQCGQCATSRYPVSRSKVCQSSNTYVFEINNNITIKAKKPLHYDILNFNTHLFVDTHICKKEHEFC